MPKLPWPQLALAGALLLPPLLHADELTRRVQEELRHRHLFNGDIDGRETPALIAALRQYQERKGLPETGAADPDTLRSMGLSLPADTGDLPDVPILRSDRGLPMGTRVPGDGMSYASTPGWASTELPSRAEMEKFFRDYLLASAGPDIGDELAFYGAQVGYFDHGIVNKSYIRNELAVYRQHWPSRRYAMLSDPDVTRRGERTVVSFRTKFEVANPTLNRTATGQTKNNFVVARRPDGRWEIVGVQEERVRTASSRGRTARRRSSDPVGNTMRKVGRTLRKVFR